ncbi:transglutaminase-like domain-containing protein [Psychroserpens algicola]|uniref:Transglutaminase-like domain-containing protein n=1 Tax=Psychroserpens algicola TaxID=1719034 RepID=A0ABT0H986_9FLAO|nr:transglutaminase-like domain-containing protein [Psychroserpens algicola]MCK8480397.1 transglutaminase-like domain-containing protein [Psychroserpens algicola]
MKHIDYKELTLGLLFLILPTILIMYPLLGFLSEYYSLLFVNKHILIGVFAAGIITAYLLHKTKIRFLIIFGLLLLVINLIYSSISASSFNEFDAYYVANRFKINTSIFVFGWFSGFAISKWRYYLIVFSILLTTISVILISDMEMSNVKDMIWLIAPTVLYLFYGLYVKELLKTIRNQKKTNYLMVVLRIFLFSLIALFLFWATIQLLDTKINHIQNEITQGQGEDEEGDSDDEEDKEKKDSKDDGGSSGAKFNLDDYLGLRDRLSVSDELLFCANIDNFINESTPNPQYITLYHLNQYNPTLEQFEIDPDSIVRDLFLPNPTKIPQYFSQQNDSVLIYDKMERAIKEVKSTIYIAGLSPEVFVAPSTAYACQPISIEEEFKKDYKFAYNVYSEVSELNSAYFVYNTTERSIVNYQERRYRTLRTAKNYDDEDDRFMEYYTEVPDGDLYNKIGQLADSLTEGDQTTIDKILSIRNYFLSEDENGEPLYTYTLTPGKPTDPNIPNASMLGEFIFNTHEGYCTYYATSSLFMLRSLGIPTRVAVGFMTVDRSHKTPGWYWFYADQAHAWTQVYIPEYGWLDFDMTVSNSDAEEAPQPDGTPPTPPTKETYVGKGLITVVDTIGKSMQVRVDKMIVNDNGISLDSTDVIDMKFDVNQAKVFAGEQAISLANVKLGDTAVMVSFDYKLGRIRPKYKSETIEDYMTLFPDPITIMEVHVPKIEEDKLNEANEEEQDSAIKTLTDWSIYILAAILLLLFILVLSPLCYYWWLSKKAKNNTSVVELSQVNYKNAHFVLNQMGVQRGHLTPMVYARDIVDPKFGTHFEAFVKIYQKLKYSEDELTDDEVTLVQGFHSDFNQKVLSKYTKSQQFINFIKPNKWIHYMLNLNLKK